VEDQIKHYDYIYIVCYFAGNVTKVDRAKFKHFEFMSKYPYLANKSVLLVISIRGNPGSLEKSLREEFDRYDYPCDVDLKFNFKKNSGGTVAALWDVWKDVVEGNFTSNYVLCLEDDWAFSNWPEREGLLENGNIYSGMVSHPTQEVLDNHVKRQVPGRFGAHNPALRGQYTEWTDGGLYLLKYNSLREIESKIGHFTKAPVNEEYDHSSHGIEYGEVGFPTELKKAGYKFEAYVGGLKGGVCESTWSPSEGAPNEKFYDK